MHMYLKNEVYCKKLDAMIMEADRSLDLQSASWRLRRVDGVRFQSESKGLRTRTANAIRPSLKISRLETQEEKMS